MGSLSGGRPTSCEITYFVVTVGLRVQVHTVDFYDDTGSQDCDALLLLPPVARVRRRLRLLPPVATARGASF